MKKLILIIASMFILTIACFSEEFKGFLGIPLGSSKTETRSAMENKGWSFISSMSDYSTYVFTGKKYAGKDVSAIMMTFQGNNLWTVVVMAEEKDSKEILDAMIKKYELKKVDGTEYYAPLDKKVVFSLISGCLAIIDGSTLENESTMESDI